ncbi:MAG: sulfatase [Armatimonadota bacterium]|nr:sulfatase [Armatimonadota bacterium]
MNIIVICLDTFRADIVGDEGALAHVKTPAMDQLAAQSANFTRAFGESQPTLQARRALMTGMRCFPWRFNVDRRGHWHHAAGWHKIPPEHDTLAEILVRQGYYTGLITDTHHMFKPTMNYTRGFCSWEFIRGQVDDHWRGGTREMVEPLMRRVCRQPIDWQRHLVMLQYFLNNRDRQSEDDYLPARVFSAASRWLDDNHANAPFFLWVDGVDPHEPWDPPPRYADMYAPEYDGIDFIWHHQGPDATDEEIQRVKALYFGEVTFVDECVGRLLETIDGLRLWDDTLVVLTSDHGTQILDHGRFGKSPRDLRWYNTQVAMHLRHPDGPRGQRIDGFVQAHDLPATLLAQLGVPAEMDGRDFWPLATGTTEAIRDYVVIAWADWAEGRARGTVSVRDDEWNYQVGTGYVDEQPALYHLAEDPHEDRNVVAEHPEVVERQRRRIEALMRQPMPGHHEEMCTRDVKAPAHTARAIQFGFKQPGEE